MREKGAADWSTQILLIGPLGALSKESPGCGYGITTSRPDAALKSRIKAILPYLLITLSLSISILYFH